MRALFTLYPNPAPKYFIIADYSNMDLGNAQIIVTDLAGRTLIKRKFTNSPEQKIDIATLPKGMYTVSIVTNIVQTQKLLVE